jgi:ethanolaminephosphotransferase
VPVWVAPNLLTFAGFLCVLAYYLLLGYYDPVYDSADELRIPSWTWITAAFLNFAAHTLGTYLISTM